MPGPDTDLPVARRKARQAAQVLVWEAYWTGVLDNPVGVEEGDSHLRSTKVLNGLHIHCTNGMFGHVDDFVFDDETWTIRYLVVETRNWWPGKHVLVEPSSIRSSAGRTEKSTCRSRGTRSQPAGVRRDRAQSSKRWSRAVEPCKAAARPLPAALQTSRLCFSITLVLFMLRSITYEASMSFSSQTGESTMNRTQVFSAAAATILAYRGDGCFGLVDKPPSSYLSVVILTISPRRPPA